MADPLAHAPAVAGRRGDGRLMCRRVESRAAHRGPCRPGVYSHGRTGGYIAFFHGPRLLLFNSVVAVAVATTAVLRLAHEANIATAASALWINTFLNVSVPLGIWGMSRAMGTYAQRSEEDDLTGLLNRRAFTDAVSNRLANPPAAHTHLAVVMVDLDNFKRVNDTHGHLAPFSA